MTDRRDSSKREKSEARLERYHARKELEEKLGRKLKPGEEAHHVNGKGSKKCGYDNCKDNLQAKKRSEHAKEDNNGRPKGSKDSVKRRPRKE